MASKSKRTRAAHRSTGTAVARRPVPTIVHHGASGTKIHVSTLLWVVVSRGAWPVVAWAGGHALRGGARTVVWGARNGGRITVASAKTLHLRSKTAAQTARERSRERALHGFDALLIRCAMPDCGKRIPHHQMENHLAHHGDPITRPLVPAGQSVWDAEPERRTLWAFMENLSAPKPLADKPYQPPAEGSRYCRGCATTFPDAKSYDRHVVACARAQLARKQQQQRDEAIWADLTADEPTVVAPPQDAAPGPTPVAPARPAGKEIVMHDPTGLLKRAVDVMSQPAMTSVEEAVAFWSLVDKEMKLLVSALAEHTLTMERIKMPKGIQDQGRRAVEAAQTAQQAFGAKKHYGESIWLTVVPEFKNV